MGKDLSSCKYQPSFIKALLWAILSGIAGPPILLVCFPIVYSLAAFIFKMKIDYMDMFDLSLKMSAFACIFLFVSEIFLMIPAILQVSGKILRKRHFILPLVTSSFYILSLVVTGMLALLMIVGRGMKDSIFYFCLFTPLIIAILFLIRFFVTSLTILNKQFIFRVTSFLLIISTVQILFATACNVIVINKNYGEAGLITFLAMLAGFLPLYLR